MISKLKKYLSDTFIKNHYLIPHAPHDYRNGINDPRIHNYSGKRSVLINARTDHGRCFEFMKLDATSNPIVRALKQSAHLDESDRMDNIRESIKEYYSNYQPGSALERYELTEKDVPGLKNQPAWSAPMPWSVRSIESEKQAVLNWHNIDHVRMGKDLDMTHGHTHFGPVSPQKLQVETERHLQVFESIKKNGYQRQDELDGDIAATIFVSKDGEWRWIAGGGHHRTISMAALEYEAIPVRVKKIVYENEVGIWPNVYSGLYSEIVAQKIFRLFFDGRAF